MARGGADQPARCLIDLLHCGALAVVNGAVVSSWCRAVSAGAVSAGAVSAVSAGLGCAGRLVRLLQDGEGHLLELLAPRVDLALIRARVKVEGWGWG
jgi:hypothetical protein